MTTASISVDRATRARARRRASRPQPLFRDLETAPAWMRWLGAAFLATGVALVAAILGWPGDAPELALVVPGVVAVAVGVLLLTARSGVSIDREAVRLHFRPLPARTVRRERLASARVVEYDVLAHGGIGLRLGRRRRSLVLSPGAGIELTDVRGRRTFVRVRRPEDALAALRTGDRTAE